MRLADHIIAVSDFTRNGLLSLGFSPDTVTTVYEGVDLRRFRPMPNAANKVLAKYHIDMRESPTLTYVGNEFPRKNLFVLLQAMRILRDKGQHVQLVKIGPSGHPRLRAEFSREMRELGVEDAVTFAGQVPDEDLPLFYSAAAAYVHPSKWEGFGLPLLEAMACGTPVVASNAAALPEVCDDAAYLVPPNNPETLAEAIQRTLTNEPLRAELRVKGLARAAQFSWKRTATGTKEVYEQVRLR
jgi:glycosyltransferase involved in cell wall biosynthesis